MAGIKIKAEIRIQSIPTDVLNMANELSDYYNKPITALCYPTLVRFIKMEHAKIKTEIEKEKAP